MIICPLTNDKCSKSVIPRAKDVFIMSRSEKDLKEKELIQAFKGVCRILKKNSFNYTIGADIKDIGDFFCNICKNILGSPFGVAFFNSEIPTPSLCNIFMEKGLMHGFGKPVILFIDDLNNLPTDFNREYVIVYNKKDYLLNFETIVKVIKELPGYYQSLGEIALKAHDYEKASRYFKERYLISGKDEFKKLKQLINTLGKKDLDAEGMKKRLLDDLESFYKLKE